MKNGTSCDSSAQKIQKFLNASPKALWAGLLTGSLAYFLVRCLIPSPKIRLAILLVVLLALIGFTGLMFRKANADEER